MHLDGSSNSPLKSAALGLMRFGLTRCRLQYIDRVTKAMRTWFKESVASKKQEVAAVIKDGEDVESERIKRDIFTRLALASQTEGKYHLNDDELVSSTRKALASTDVPHRSVCLMRVLCPLLTILLASAIG